MRTVAVVPFGAPAEDEEAADLAAMVAQDAVDVLLGAGVAANVAAARSPLDETGADFALGGALRIDDGELTLAAMLVDAGGEVLAEWEENLTVGHAPQLGRMMARAVLLAIGEEAPATTLDAPVEPADALVLARGRRLLETDPLRGAELLVSIAARLPAAAQALIAAASGAEGSGRMPIFFGALERLVDERPQDVEVLLAAARYRALHLDGSGARELYELARDLAAEAAPQARALSGLAALAEEAGRADEAIAHLRNAVRLVDDAQLFARLGRLLLPRDPVEGARMLTRAAVLAPEDAALRAQLSASR